jgi:hypothetical protein
VKVSALNALAPMQTEPPFAVTQGHNKMYHYHPCAASA